MNSLLILQKLMCKLEPSESKLADVFLKSFVLFLVLMTYRVDAMVRLRAWPPRYSLIAQIP